MDLPNKTSQNSTNLIQAFSKRGTNAIFTFNNTRSAASGIFSIFKRQRIICIHGMKYLDEKEAKQYIKKLIWFTYRDISCLSQTVNSDRGWGCLIRVGQMVLAAALRLHYKQKFDIEPKNIDLIPFFLEQGGQQKYSLMKIVQKGKHLFKTIDYTKWFTVPEMCQTLQNLHLQSCPQFAKTLKIISFESQIIYFQQIIEKLEQLVCKCQKKRIICQKCHSSRKKIADTKNIQSLKSTINSGYEHQSLSNVSSLKEKNVSEVLILVYSYMGISVEKRQFAFIKQLLNLQFSLGILGGVPKKAYYLIGYDNEDIIYMDPHYVHKQVTKKNLQAEIQTFVNKTYMKIGFKSLDPSMAFAFLIKSLDDIQTLKKKLEQLKDKGLQYFGVKWDKDTQEYSQSLSLHQSQGQGFELAQ